MKIQENTSLQAFNTFGIDVRARYFTALQSVSEMQALLQQDQWRDQNKFILGGGSNILFTKDVDALVIKNELRGIAVVKEDDEAWYVQSGAGENWHGFVMHCIAQGWSGVENLSLIPGNVGAGPMQNIGAYGVELKDVFHELEALNIATGEIETFDNAACQFGYRESVFKRALKGQHIITSVTFRLLKTPVLNTSYGAIEQELERLGETSANINNISQAVINIRQSKLPDPNKIGNAGSFFKNPVVDNELVEKVRTNFPNVVSYPVSETHSKLAAGWLIDNAGWKGHTRDTYGVHKNQALVLVNYGGAQGNQIYDLSTDILASVKEKYGVDLEREVNIL